MREKFCILFGHRIRPTDTQPANRFTDLTSKSYTHHVICLARNCHETNTLHPNDKAYIQESYKGVVKAASCTSLRTRDCRAQRWEIRSMGRKTEALLSPSALEVALIPLRSTFPRFSLSRSQLKYVIYV